MRTFVANHVLSRLCTCFVQTLTQTFRIWLRFCADIWTKSWRLRPLSLGAGAALKIAPRFRILGKRRMVIKRKFNGFWNGTKRNIRFGHLVTIFKKMGSIFFLKKTITGGGGPFFYTLTLGNTSFNKCFLSGIAQITSPTPPTPPLLSGNLYIFFSRHKGIYKVYFLIQAWPSPPLIWAMPERKHFFYMRCSLTPKVAIPH